MRFPQLSIGQRFRFQGKIYCKTGPLTASEEGTGSSRLIAKSTEVTLLDSALGVAETKQQFSRSEIEALCAGFRAQLSATIQDRAGPKTSMAVREVLELIAAQALAID